MAPDSLEGQNLGKYRVLEPLGRGGMARVYRAYHPQLDRYVAIKVLRSDLVEEEEFLARFKREARAVASLCAIPTSSRSSTSTPWATCTTWSWNCWRVTPWRRA